MVVLPLSRNCYVWSTKLLTACLAGDTVELTQNLLKHHSMNKDLQTRAQIVFLCLFVTAIASHVTAAEIDGTVTADDGTPVANTAVIVNTSSVAGPVATVLSQVTRTASDGTFSVTGLLAGPYSICTLVLRKGLLNPCEWGPDDVVTVSSASAVVSCSLTLSHGVIVTAHVKDPTEIIPYVGQAPTSKNVQLYILTAAGAQHPLLGFDSDKGEHEYRIVVPKGAQVYIGGMAANVQLLGANTNAGAGIDANGSVIGPTSLAQLNTSGSAQQFYFQVAALP